MKRQAQYLLIQTFCLGRARGDWEGKNSQAQTPKKYLFVSYNQLKIGSVDRDFNMLISHHHVHPLTQINLGKFVYRPFSVEIETTCLKSEKKEVFKCNKIVNVGVQSRVTGSKQYFYLGLSICSNKSYTFGLGRTRVR